MWIPASWRSQNVVHNCQEQGKDYDIYLMSEKLVTASRSTKKMFASYLEVHKTGSQLFQPDKYCWSYLEREKVVPCYLETKKCSSQLLGARKKIMTAILKSDKPVDSQQEHEKNVSQLFGSVKNWFLAISSLTNTVTAIWTEKNVDSCYLETKKSSLQLLGARKEIMISI